MSDQHARDRIRTSLGETICVEAGAGTGKTRALVDRITELIGTGLLTMDHLAAITFTEAAAAELRDRVRSRLEEAAREEQDPDRRRRCEEGASCVDLAAIQTIHSFAGELLRSNPIEAGLPPGFATWDEIREGQEFEDRFHAWLFDVVPDALVPTRRVVFRRAFALGMTPDNLRGLARAVQEHYDLLDAAMPWQVEEPPDVITECRACGAALLDLCGLLQYAQNGEADPLVREVRRAELTAARMAATNSAEEALVAFRELKDHSLKQVGTQKEWPGADGKSAIQQIKATIKQICGSDGTVSRVLEQQRTATVTAVLCYLRDFTLDYAAARKRIGVASFHDLLTWTRDLLRDNPDVRRRAHARFRRVFVDEFQDTDPLQAEIVSLLAGDTEYAEERDWRLVPLEPGVLFLVGDPKQSIYRFRRADIAIYKEVYDRIEAGRPREYLVQNFRSAVPILTCVNLLFADLMHAERYAIPNIQAEYVDLDPEDGRPETPAGSVRSIGERGDWKAPEKWRREAEAVALTAAQIVAERWQASERVDGELKFRDVDYGDICILMPTRTNLRLIERHLQEQVVPYRVTSGTLILDTQEVRDLLACLRAIDDPSDQVALVAALRSPAYACADTDLFAWVRAGGELNYLADVAAEQASSPVARAFDSLRAFYARRLTASPAALTEAFIRDRGLAVQAYGHPRPREAWRRLRYVVDRARSFAGNGRPSLRTLLDWLDDRRVETFYDAESPTLDADERAVQLMTIHGAKGLEFPAVILAGLGSRGNAHRGPSVVAGSGPNQLEAYCGEFQTAGWDKAHEDALDEAEDVRLLYVAATRARDYLVVSLFHAKQNCTKPGCYVERILAAVERGSLPEIEGVVLHDHRPVRQTAMSVSSPASDETPETDWVAERAKRIDQLAEQRVLTPSQLHGAASTGFVVEVSDDPLPESEVEAVDTEDEGSADPLPRGRAATALGRAVHAALQFVDLSSLANLDLAAARAARICGVEDQAETVHSLVAALAGSTTVRAAVAGGRYWREAPVGVALGGITLNGVVDLVFELPGGRLGMVDYKTDQIAAADVPARAAYYRPQIGAYALALERATKLPVAFAELLFATEYGVQVQRYEGAALVAAIAEANAKIAAELAVP
jgi:ATP-dependent exoDNAse (exonuclease V) beta subunit